MLPAVALALSAGSAAAQTTTGQVWLSAEGTADLTPPLRLGVEQQLRLDADAGYDQTFTELGLRYRVVDWLRVGGFYRLAFLDGETGGETRHRVGADGEAVAKLDPLEIRYRLRLQHTTRDQGGATALRNRLKVAVDAPHKLEPFALGELFYALEKSELREVRVAAGLDWSATKKLTLTAFYLYQHELNVAAPEHHHVLGLAVSWQLREARSSKKKEKKEKKEKGRSAPD